MSQQPAAPTRSSSRHRSWTAAKSFFILVIILCGFLAITAKDREPKPGMSQSEWESGKRYTFIYKGEPLQCWSNTFNGFFDLPERTSWFQTALSCDYQAFYASHPTLLKSPAKLSPEKGFELIHLDWQGWDAPCIRRKDGSAYHTPGAPALSCDFQHHKQGVPREGHALGATRFKGEFTVLPYRGGELNCLELKEYRSASRGGRMVFSMACDFETFYSHQQGKAAEPEFGLGQPVKNIVWMPWDGSYLPCYVRSFGTACDWYLFYQLHPDVGLEPSLGVTPPKWVQSEVAPS